MYLGLKFEIWDSLGLELEFFSIVYFIIYLFVDKMDK